MSIFNIIDSGNEWGEAEFRWSQDRECWLEAPSGIGFTNTTPPDDRLKRLRIEGGEDVTSEICHVYRVKYPHE